MDSITTMTIAPSAHTGDASTKPRAGLLAALRKPLAGSSNSSAESEDESSESDCEAAAPAPRTKSISLLAQPVAIASQESNEDSDNGAAYERMKKRLAAKKTSAESRPTQSIEEVAPVTAAAVSSEDEDEMPVKANIRRSNIRKAKSRSQSASPIPTVRSRQSSPGLFVTPNASPLKSRIAANSASESDEPSRNLHNDDLQARVRRIRAERLAKKKEEEYQKQQKEPKASERRLQQASGSDTDGENGRRLTQQAKPTRKAGKKAMELMARDQQRISRNMQLTHQSKTKKRFPLNDLYSRFGMTVPNIEKTEVVSLPTPDASSALASSDAEANQIHNTPPASPPSERQWPAEVAMETSHTITEITPTVSSESLLLSAVVDKGKGRAAEFQHLPPHPWTKQDEKLTVHNAQVDARQSADQVMVDLSDSEDDLEVVQTKTRFPVFDRIPLKKQQESSSLLHLRHLAHLTSKDTRKGPKSISLGEMHMSLAQKAREQGQKEREEKIADLKRRGIHIETEEEREKNQMEIEDIVAQFEKQRQEDLKLAKTERKEAKENGETLDGLPSSDESDGDYVGSGEEDTNEAEAEAQDEDEIELELSGSEDEDMEIQENADKADVNDSNGLIADMADDDHEDNEDDLAVVFQEQQLEDDADMEDEGPSAPIRKRTSIRPRNVIVDEEDESDNEPLMAPSPTHKATQNDAMAAFGFGNADVGLGLTQMFAGTMANLDSGSQSTIAEPEQDSLDFLRGLPDTQPGAHFSQMSDFVIPNSQSLMSPQKASQTGPETQFSLGISQLIKNSPPFSRTQVDDLPEPTQDAGFSFSRSPAGLKPPPSTVDTVMMSVAESPIKQKKGKLLRGRRDAAVELSDVEEDLTDVETALSEEDDIQRPPKPRDAFVKLQKGAKKQKARDDFNKKTSLAKDAVMDQAEESEDEYAGLGGASDDDSGVEDEESNDMIEHGEVEVDERQLAAFFA
jgi:mediator of replication checkpoint protein 1